MKRKSIPDRVKLLAALKRQGLTIERVQFDHQPPLALRPINPETGDTIPPANDPDHIFMLTVEEHHTKTFGRGGEKRTSTADGDIHKIRKAERISEAQEEARRRMLARDEGEPQERTRVKTKWPKRQFPNKRKPK